jgi:hypothetical protein
MCSKKMSRVSYTFFLTYLGYINNQKRLYIYILTTLLMSILTRIPWFHRKSKNSDDSIRDVAEMLTQGKSRRRSRNLKFVREKDRIKSPTHLFGREQLREAIIHAVVIEDKKK